MKILLILLLALSPIGCSPNWVSRQHAKDYVCLIRKGTKTYVTTDGHTVVYRIYNDGEQAPNTP